MKRVVFIVVILCMLLSGSLFARDIVGLGIGVTGMYDPSDSNSFETFFNGMGLGDRWTLGLALNARISIVDMALMVIPCDNDETGDGMTLLSATGFSIPVVNDFLYLKLGAGFRTEFQFPETGEATVRGNGQARSVADVSFSEVFFDSPIHLRFGFDFVFGPAILSFVYLWESQATLYGFQNPGGWATILQPGEMDRLGVTFQLALF